MDLVNVFECGVDDREAVPNEDSWYFSIYREAEKPRNCWYCAKINNCAHVQEHGHCSQFE